MAHYTVRSGDTLTDIARREGVDLFDLVAANRGINPNLIRPGQTIRIPERTYSEAQRSQAAVDIAATDPTGRFSATGIPGGGLGVGTPTPGLVPQIVSPLSAPTIAQSIQPSQIVSPYTGRRPASDISGLTAGQVAARTAGQPVPLPTGTTPSPQTQISQIVSPYSGRNIGGTPTPTTQPTGSLVGRIIGAYLGGLGGGILGGAKGTVEEFRQAFQQTRSPNFANIIPDVLRGAFRGGIQGSNIFGQPSQAITPSAATQPGVTPTAATTPGGRPLFPGTYLTQEQRLAAQGGGARDPRVAAQQFFGGSPDVAQLRAESWARSVAVHASFWASQTDIPSYTSLQLFIDAQAQLGNVLTLEQATQVLSGLGYTNVTGSIWYRPRPNDYGTGSGAAAGGGYGSIIGSGGGSGGGGGTESGFRGGFSVGLYQWRIGA